MATIARVCLALALIGVAEARAEEIWVVTDQAHPVKAPAGVRIIALDRAARLQADISAQLPSDASRAAMLVRRRLHARGGEFQRTLRDAYQDVTDAWSVGVTKIPAVVVDRRYVVYGESNVARALAYVETYRRRQ